MAEQDEMVGRTAREQAEAYKLLQCLCVKGNGMAQEMYRVYQALVDETKDEVKVRVDKEKALVYFTKEECENLMRDIRNTRQNVNSLKAKMAKLQIRPMND